MREAIYHNLTPALRQGLHREAARVLTAAGAPVGQVADHLFLGASATDPEARKWLRAGSFRRRPSIAGGGSQSIRAGIRADQH